MAAAGRTGKEALIPNARRIDPCFRLEANPRLEEQGHWQVGLVRPIGETETPFEPAFPAEAEAGPTAAYEYEPDEEEILAELLPRYIAVQVYRALLENAASFYGAQMSAMDNATRNAGEMIRKQTLRYNRTRQAQITKELIEIISGAEAL